MRREGGVWGHGLRAYGVSPFGFRIEGYGRPWCLSVGIVWSRQELKNCVQTTTSFSASGSLQSSPIPGDRL